MRNIRLVIEYDGTAYHGWQSQSNARAVQDVIEAALKKLTGEECRLTGASRTDVGVHALGQVANFYTSSKIPGEKFSFALNTMLPPDIRIRKSEEVDYNFHSRYMSKGKLYKYLVFNSKHPSALLRHRAWHVPYDLDFDKMEKAARLFEGRHDFRAFYRERGSSVRSTVRTITGIKIVQYEVCEQAGLILPPESRLIELSVSGDGFLYNMVRIIAGTLVEVGMGRLTCEDVGLLLEDGDRVDAGRTAPACGLYLVEVFY